jgi:Rps23 Pro-64 3,4-dihydroxylase Tpa1-like proline 4-hydroxylase
MLEYIKRRQKQLEKKWQRAAELEAKKEAARVAKMEAEARKQEEIAARKKLLLEQQEAERLRQKHIQRKEKLAEQKWNNQFDTLLAQIKDRAQKDNKLEEIRIIIQNREPSLQELDWASWLSDPLNQKLADLDFDYAMEMFKRDNLMAKRRHGTRVP